MSEIDNDAKVLSNASEELSTTSQQLGANSQPDHHPGGRRLRAKRLNRSARTSKPSPPRNQRDVSFDQEISKNASEAAEVASSARAPSPATTTATMTKLSESSAEIGNVIQK